MDKNGVAHTVAVPRPSGYVDPAFMTYLRLHRAELDYEYRDFLEKRSITEFADAAHRFADGDLREQALPDDVNIGEGYMYTGESFRTAVDSAIARVSVQWRLDAVLVLGDLLDDWDDDGYNATS